MIRILLLIEALCIITPILMIFLLKREETIELMLRIGLILSVSINGFILSYYMYKLIKFIGELLI